MGDKWKCAVCGALNPLARTVCVVCAAAAPAPVRKLAAVAPPQTHLTLNGLVAILERAGLVYTDGRGVFNGIKEGADLTPEIIAATRALNDFFNGNTTNPEGT